MAATRPLSDETKYRDEDITIKQLVYPIIIKQFMLMKYYSLTNIDNNYEETIVESGDKRKLLDIDSVSNLCKEDYNLVNWYNKMYETNNTQEQE